MPEVRRLVLAMTENSERRAFRMGWSVWRRAHQAVAAHCHAARRTRKRDGSPRVHVVAPPATVRAELTNTEWERVRPLLPPQQPPRGRPRHDHRAVLGGILWVLRTQASWRDMPDGFGKWQTAYKRYRLWRATGLWQRILSTLRQGADHQTAEVAL